MTPLSPMRRAAEEFASAVDGSRAETGDRYADLLTCVDVLRAREIPEPRADFVADLRMRLMDAADTLLLPASAELAPVVPLNARANRNQRRISVAAAAFVVIGGSAGVAAAAESALPGDALYPIKRGIESAQVALNSSDSGKGQDLLRQAGERLVEIDALLAEDSSAEAITRTLSAFERSVTDGADLMLVEYQRNGDPEDITRLRTMIGSQLTQLDALAAEAPEDSLPAFASARDLLADLDQQASVLCSDCGAGAVTDRFATSASALGDLFNVPVSTPADRAAADRRSQKLAERADAVAKNDKLTKPGVPDVTGTPPATPVPEPGLPLPAPGGGGVDVVVGGLSSGVSALLGEDPLTTTLGTTLESLTDLP